MLHISGMICREQDKLEDYWRSDISPAVEQGSSNDQLDVSWWEGQWNCKLALDRRHDDGIWAIVHAECRSRDGEVVPGVGINYDAHSSPWLWFYTLQHDDLRNESYVWWKCPWQIVEILQTHIKGRRRGMREGGGGVVTFGPPPSPLSPPLPSLCPVNILPPSVLPHRRKEAMAQQRRR